jgi:hypothetical protein
MTLLHFRSKVDNLRGYPSGLLIGPSASCADRTPSRERVGSVGDDMLVAGGKTSTLTQFTELARQAGLEIVAARAQSSGRFVVECRPATQ